MHASGHRPQDFDASYLGTPPWDIGRPQTVFLELAAAGEIHGRVLDAAAARANTHSWQPGSESMPRVSTPHPEPSTWPKQRPRSVGCRSAFWYGMRCSS